MKYILKQGQGESLRTADTFNENINVILSNEDEVVRISLNSIIELFMGDYLKRELKTHEELLVLYKGSCRCVKSILLCTKSGLCVDNYMSVTPGYIKLNSESIYLNKQEKETIQAKYQMIKRALRKRGNM